MDRRISPMWQEVRTRLSVGRATLGLISLLTGCATLQVPAQHVVMFNGDGTPVDATGNIGCQSNGWPCNGSHTSFLAYKKMTHEEYDTHLSSIMQALKDYPVRAGKRKVLVFVHG